MIFNYRKYYNEIKNRFIIIVLTGLVNFIICYQYKETALFILIDSNCLFDRLNTKSHFIFTNVTEIFHVYFELSLFFSNQTLIFMILYQLLMFLVLGLYNFEFRNLNFTFQTFIYSWIISLLLLFKLIVPFSWSFFLSFQENSNLIQPISFHFEAKLIEYLSYFISLYYICFISCQFLTFLLVILTSFNKTLEKTKTLRKLFYIIFISFSTIITPPDILSQICISWFLILAYECILLLKQIQTNMATN